MLSACQALAGDGGWPNAPLVDGSDGVVDPCEARQVIIGLPQEAVDCRLEVDRQPGTRPVNGRSGPGDSDMAALVTLSRHAETEAIERLHAACMLIEHWAISHDMLW